MLPFKSKFDRVEKFLVILLSFSLISVLFSTAVSWKIFNQILRENQSIDFFLVCIFLYSDWIQPEKFSPNTGKYGPEKTPYLDTFHVVKLISSPRIYGLTPNPLHTKTFAAKRKSENSVPVNTSFLFRKGMVTLLVSRVDSIIRLHMLI